MCRRLLSQTKQILVQLWIDLKIHENYLLGMFPLQSRNCYFSQDPKTFLSQGLENLFFLTLKAQGAWPPTVSVDWYKETLLKKNLIYSLKFTLSGEDQIKVENY